MTRRKKILLISPVIFIVLSLAAIVYCDNRVEAASQGRLFDDAAHIPHRHTGLLLGTSKYLSSGYINLYYKYRIDATIALMKAGKIDYLVISGDNGHKEYNEPEMMRDDLVAAGIDSSRIFLDYAGFRTFDSIIRLSKIFSQDSVTVISQQFHTQRALYIAQREGIHAIAFNAQDVAGASGTRTWIRERLARVKVFVDYIISNEPKFLGPKVAVP